MAISSKLLRVQLNVLKPLLSSLTLETSRAAQDRIGLLMAKSNHNKVIFEKVEFENFSASWAISKKCEGDKVILYLHGGGYVTGDLDYSIGFGSTLADKNHLKVFCVAYRLAPENPYPAALTDALEAYKYLLDNGYSSKNIVLCGESAGGGLIFALTLKIKELKLPMPNGIIAISPWTDLTLTSESFNTNIDNDPTLTKERLAYFQSLYSEDVTNPYVSPLFGDLSDMPPSLIFVGGDEILLDDSVKIHKKLIENKNKSYLFIAPKMWHVYILFGTNEAKKDHKKIEEFLKEIFNESK